MLFLRGANGSVNSTGADNVVFLDQDCVKQPDPVIVAAATADGLLLSDPQAGNRLSRIENPGLEVGDSIDITRCYGRRCG